MFTFTPLLGAQTDSDATQSIIELDGGIKILVDVGWDETFDVGQLSDLDRHVDIDRGRIRTNFLL
jgi:cleavage and polyadenylation specificity factor subunit 2